MAALVSVGTLLTAGVAFAAIPDSGDGAIWGAAFQCGKRSLRPPNGTIPGHMTAATTTAPMATTRASAHGHRAGAGS